MDMLERVFVVVTVTCLVVLVGLTTFVALSAPDPVPSRVLKSLTTFQVKAESARVHG